MTLPNKLGPRYWTVSQSDIDRYAQFSGANDPLHVDPTFASTTEFGKTIAQGLLLHGRFFELIEDAATEADLIWPFVLISGFVPRSARRQHRILGGLVPSNLPTVVPSKFIVVGKMVQLFPKDFDRRSYRKRFLLGRADLGIVAVMRSLLDTATAEKRDLTAEEQAKYDQLFSEQETTGNHISREERQHELDRQMAEAASRPIETPRRNGIRE